MPQTVQIWCVKFWLAIQNLVLQIAEGLMFRQRRPVSEPRSILLYRTGRLGDFLNAVPAMAQLRRMFPHTRIGLLTTASTEPASAKAASTYGAGPDTLPWLSFVCPALVDECHVFSMLSGLNRMKEPARQFIRDLDPEIAFLLPFSTEPAAARLKKLALFWFVGVRCRVYGIRLRSTKKLFSRAQFEAGAFEHHAVVALRALQEWPAMARSAGTVTFPLSVDAAAVRWADELWSSRGWRGELTIAVFPGVSFAHRRWPVEKYAALCRRIHSAYNPRFVFLGLASDKHLTAELVKAVGERGLDLAGDTSLDRLAAILQRVNLFVGNDSGPAHLASAVGCPCVTVMNGIEYPGFGDAWASRADAVRHDVACSPCNNFNHCPRGTQECVQGVTVDQVFEKLGDVIGRWPGNCRLRQPDVPPRVTAREERVSWGSGEARR
jgi:ADP-heptose:LPS heptosyltransferase